VRQQIADALVGIARHFFEVCANLAPQTGNLLRQNNAKFSDEATQPVIECGTLLDETLPSAMQVLAAV